MKFFNKNVLKIKVNKSITINDEKGLGNTTNQNGGAKKCVGCGHEMHTDDKRKPGFSIDPENQDYCLRCFKIKNYNELVEQEINDKDFIDILNNINTSSENIRYYYVVDIFDLPGSRLEWLEKLIGIKEVVIVANKVDLLPKSVSHDKIKSYLRKYFAMSTLRNSQIILTSSFKLDLSQKLLDQFLSVDYDQYVVGVSNAGKSSLINACLQCNSQVPSIVTSKYVNTTLDKIKINFTEKNFIYDTPGLVKHNHIAIATAPSYWDFFFFKKEIKQVTYQLQKGQTIFYGGVAWFAYIDGSEKDEKGKDKKVSFHFYVNRELPLHRTKTDNSQEYFERHKHILAPRLINVDSDFFIHKFEFSKAENIDIHISGLGWINLTTFPGLKLQVAVPDVELGIKVTMLPALI